MAKCHFHWPLVFVVNGKNLFVATTISKGLKTSHLTNLLVVKTESFHCISSIADESHPQNIPRWSKRWWFVRSSIKNYVGSVEMICVVDHQEVLASLRFKFCKVKPDFLVHRNLYLPRAVFVVVVIGRVIRWLHSATWASQKCTTACCWKKNISINCRLSIDTSWIITAYSLMDYRIDVELLKSFYFNSFLIFKNKKH